MGLAAIPCPCGSLIALSQSDDGTPRGWTVFGPKDRSSYPDFEESLLLATGHGERGDVDSFITCRCGRTYHARPEAPYVVPAAKDDETQ